MACSSLMSVTQRGAVMKGSLGFVPVVRSEGGAAAVEPGRCGARGFAFTFTARVCVRARCPRC